MSGPTGARGPYAGTADRRASILAVAWDVFAKQGYRSGSLREMSARLGFSQAGMLYHFGSKQNLLMEVLNYRESLNFPEDATVRGVALLDHLRSVVTRNAETPGAVRLFVTMSAEATEPSHPAHQFFVARYQQLLARFTDAFALGQDDGDLGQNLDPEMAARQLIAFLDGIQLQWLLTPSFDMLTAYDQYVTELLALHRRTVAKSS